MLPLDGSSNFQQGSSHMHHQVEMMPPITKGFVSQGITILVSTDNTMQTHSCPSDTFQPGSQ